jgi:hypothetical protein
MREAYLESYQDKQEFGWVVWIFLDDIYQSRIICKQYQVALMLKNEWVSGGIIGF